MLDLMWRCIPTECMTPGALKKKHGMFTMDSPPPTTLMEVVSNVEFIEKANTSSFMKKDSAGGGKSKCGAPTYTSRSVAIRLLELDHGIDWSKVERMQFKSSDAAHGIPGVLHDEFGLPPWTHIHGTSKPFTKRNNAILKVIDVDDLDGRSGGEEINQGLAGLGFDHGNGRCASPFPPILIEVAMKRSLPVLGKGHLPAVLDVTAGGPIRGTMVSMFGAKYIGVELSKEQVAANILTGQRTSSKFGEALYYQNYPRFKV
mmetsp:Transcript_6057/g.15434  ORF Transcript_6057/g.15434 Transcript_6057/m.15434 type:complete len:259 (+) Transcript_6057:505-1281(+)